MKGTDGFLFQFVVIRFPILEYRTCEIPQTAKTVPDEDSIIPESGTEEVCRLLEYDVLEYDLSCSTEFGIGQINQIRKEDIVDYNALKLRFTPIEDAFDA